MKIDFHTHGKLSKQLPFSADYTRLLFQEAKKAGLDALCLTEHFNTREFKEVYKYLYESYSRRGDFFFAEGVQVFPGMEVDIYESGHILFIGDIESILAIDGELEPYKEKEKFLSFSNLLKMTEKYDVIRGAAHPFREGGTIPSLDTGLLKQLDFVELNGKDYGTQGTVAEEMVSHFAQSLGLPVVGGSDTHQSFQYGCIWNRLKKDCTTIGELRESISKEAYKIEMVEYIEFKVKTAGILKKALKEIYACGGDCMSVLAAE